MYSAVETSKEIKLYDDSITAYRNNSNSTGVFQATMEEALQTGKDVYIHSEDKWIIS